jgi:hypothetical protein
MTADTESNIPERAALEEMGWATTSEREELESTDAVRWYLGAARGDYRVTGTVTVSKLELEHGYIGPETTIRFKLGRRWAQILREVVTK